MTEGQLGAVVLCGGESRRMGADKATLPFGNETLLARVVRLVRQATADIVLAAAEGQATPAPYPVSRDSAPGEGPLPGLLRAAVMLHTDRVFVVSCDTPLLEPAVIGLLAGLSVGWDGAVPVLEGRRVATCAVYRRAALLDARARFGEPRHRSLQAYLALLRIRDVDAVSLRAADPDLRSFVPCNTPAEYREALRLAGLPVQGSLPPVI